MLISWLAADPLWWPWKAGAIFLSYTLDRARWKERKKRDKEERKEEKLNTARRQRKGKKEERDVF